MLNHDDSTLPFPDASSGPTSFSMGKFGILLEDDTPPIVDPRLLQERDQMRRRLVEIKPQDSLEPKLRQVAQNTQTNVFHELDLSLQKTQLQLAKTHVNKSITMPKTKTRRTLHLESVNVDSLVNSALEQLNQLTLSLQAREKEEKEAKEKAEKAEEARQAQAKVEQEAKVKLQQEALEKQAQEQALAKQIADKEAAEKQALEKQALEKQVVEKESEAKQLEQLKQQSAQPIPTFIPSNSEDIAPTAAQESKQLLDIIARIKNEIRPVVKQNKQLERYVFEEKMSATTKIGQLTAAKTQITRIARGLTETLMAAKKKSPVAYEWLLDFVAKQIAKQAETEVAVNPTMAYPLARVAQNIALDHPDFKNILLARLYKKCIYVTPKYCNQLPNETIQDYNSRIKRKQNDSEMEKSALYEERMCGMVNLFAALVQPLPGMPPNASFGMDKAWTWLARICNLKPQKITPQLLFTFLNSVGSVFITTFQSQAHKLLRFVMTSFIPLIPQEGIAGSTRLQLMLEDYQRTGKIPDPEGKMWDLNEFY